jgi:hypothetical protein
VVLQPSENPGDGVDLSRFRASCATTALQLTFDLNCFNELLRTSRVVATCTQVGTAVTDVGTSQSARFYPLAPFVAGADQQYVLCFCRALSAFTCFVSCLQTLRRAIDEVRHELSYMPSFSCVVFSAVSHDLYVSG